MIRAINIIGFLFLPGAFAFYYFSEKGFSYHALSIFLFGLALLAIPVGYTLNLTRVFGWLLVFIAIYIFTVDDNLMSIIAFIIFFVGGRIAGLTFKVDNGD